MISWSQNGIKIQILYLLILYSGILTSEFLPRSVPHQVGIFARPTLVVTSTLFKIVLKFIYYLLHCTGVHIKSEPLSPPPSSSSSDASGDSIPPSQVCYRTKIQYELLNWLVNVKWLVPKWLACLPNNLKVVGLSPCTVTQCCVGVMTLNQSCSEYFYCIKPKLFAVREYPFGRMINSLYNLCKM